ncbi:MAG: hypothetical protein KBD51_01125 [Candidatus Levybacteria bacterium]|nr:hypothetical protein [Candidatus Levybacteria bacterium]
MAVELPDKRGDEFRVPQRTEAPAYAAAFTSHADWFGSFIANTDQKVVQRITLLDGLQRFQGVWDKAIDPAQDFRVLLLGAGRGDSELAALSQLKELRGDMSKVSILVEEPSAQMQGELLTSAQERGFGANIKGIEGKEFEDPTYVPPGVDLAVGFQMWQYVKGWEGVPAVDNSLEKLRATVAERGGASVISVMSQTSDNFALRSKYLPVIHGEGTTETTAEMISDQLYAPDLETPHDIIITPSTLNVSSVFPDGRFDPTPEGANILSFILRADWNVLPDGLKVQVAQDLEYLVRRNDGYRLSFRDAYVWLPGIDN